MVAASFQRFSYLSKLTRMAAKKAKSTGLFHDKVILAVDITDLARAQAVARDFRVCTHTIKVGQALYTAHGPIGARSFHELGMSDVILDIRLCGKPWEVWASVTEAAKIRGVAGVTLQAGIGLEGMKSAKNASVAGLLTSNNIRAPRLLVSALPMSTMAPASRAKYLLEVVANCRAAKMDGLIVDYYDLPLIASKSADVNLLANAKRGVSGALHGVPENQRKLPGVGSVLRAGAACTFFDAVLLGKADTEWAADTLQKELTFESLF